MIRTAPSTTTIDPPQLLELIHWDLRRLENHLLQGTHSTFPITRRGQEDTATAKAAIREWRDALHHLSIKAAREITPELVQEWMQLRQQMVMKGPLGLRRSLIPHRTRHYELDY